MVLLLGEEGSTHHVVCYPNLRLHLSVKTFLSHELRSSLKIIEGILKVLVRSEKRSSQDEELCVVSIEFKSLLNLVEGHLLVAFKDILYSRLIELLSLGLHDLQELHYLPMVRLQRMGNPELFISFFYFIHRPLQLPLKNENLNITCILLETVLDLTEC